MSGSKSKINLLAFRYVILYIAFRKNFLAFSSSLFKRRDTSCTQMQFPFVLEKTKDDSQKTIKVSLRAYHIYEKASRNGYQGSEFNLEEKTFRYIE